MNPPGYSGGVRNSAGGRVADQPKTLLCYPKGPLSARKTTQAVGNFFRILQIGYVKQTAVVGEISCVLQRRNDYPRGMQTARH
jgi:hypothetical protein